MGASEGRRCWTRVGRRRSSAEAAALTSEVQLRSDQILTCFTASVHVTHDGPADLRADTSPREDKESSSSSSHLANG